MTLRRIENVSARWSRGFAGLFTGQGSIKLTVGRKTHYGSVKLTRPEWDEMVALSDADWPV
jgi:hypothetical protein